MDFLSDIDYQSVATKNYFEISIKVKYSLIGIGESKIGDSVDIIFCDMKWPK